VDKEIKLSTVHKKCGKTGLWIKKKDGQDAIWCAHCQEWISDLSKEILWERPPKS